MIGSGWVTVTLASSLFFRLSPGASQAQVIRYLVITLLPMAALTPVLGPLLDRRVTDAATYAVRSNHVRSVCCVGLALTLGTTAFYAVALLLLVANKAYSVSKSALLPRLVEDRAHLVAANSRISKWSAVSAALATGAGVAMAATVGSRPTLCAAAVAFAMAAAAARRVPPAADTAGRDSVGCAAVAHRPSLRLRAAGFQFTAIRAAVGMFAFGAAFAMRRAGASAVDLALAGGLYGIGSFAGNVAAPWARRRMGEERMLELCLAATGAASALTLLSGSTHLVPLVAATLGCAASLGRLAFDSVLQATTADGSRGRCYARFETRLQVGWVAGALAATVAAFDLLPTVLSVGVLMCIGAAQARGRRARGSPRAAARPCEPRSQRGAGRRGGRRAGRGGCLVPPRHGRPVGGAASGGGCRRPPARRSASARSTARGPAARSAASAPPAAARSARRSGTATARRAARRPRPRRGRALSPPFVAQHGATCRRWRGRLHRRSVAAGG